MNILFDGLGGLGGLAWAVGRPRICSLTLRKPFLFASGFTDALYECNASQGEFFTEVI